MPAYGVGAVGSAIALALLAGVAEEPGWRGVASDALQRRMPPAWTAVAIGAVWSLWHLPLAFIDGTYYQGLGFGSLAYGLTHLALVQLGVLYLWLANGAGGSILIAILAHAGFNVARVPRASEPDGRSGRPDRDHGRHRGRALDHEASIEGPDSTDRGRARRWPSSGGGRHTRGVTMMIPRRSPARHPHHDRPPGTPADHAAVHHVHTTAFTTPEEAVLVDALRAGASPLVSLVAEDDGRVVGHVMFSPVTLPGHPDLRLMGLAPLAVLPTHQRRGLGAALARAGLERCREVDIGAVFVLGDPKYYGRFGFVRADAIGCPFEAPAEDWMLVELQTDYLRGATGPTRWHPAFDAL